MTNVTTDTIPNLLVLNPSVPEQAIRLRIGIAKLAGWQDVRELGDGKIIGTFPPVGFFYELPVFESSLDAALALLDSDLHLYLSRKSRGYAFNSDDGTERGYWRCELLDINA